MPSCSHCGADMTPADRFCGDCGTPLADAASQPGAA
ncbi:MAG: zinc-ribbon domain-containing protein, partial [Pyrinomonadaceae bacterium]